METKQPEAYEFVWSADVSVSNEYGEITILSVSNSGNYTGAVYDHEIEQSCWQWALEQLDEDPANVEMVSFTWSAMPKIDVPAGMSGEME